MGILSDRSEEDRPRPRMIPFNQKSSSELGVSSIHLINISRSPSPSQQRRSESNADYGTDDDDDDWGDSVRRQSTSDDLGKDQGWRGIVYSGGCGQFFFNTALGWQLYIGILILWLGGCQIGLILMNRIILWSGYLHENYTHHTKLMVLIAGVYKFPYPLTTTLMELLITHFFILLSAYITRWFSPWLISAGLSGGIAPSKPSKNQSPIGCRSDSRLVNLIVMWLQRNNGGIAGGGFFEFDLEVAKIVLPCASIFVAKVLLSNLSFAYAQLQIYFLARIAIVPLSLLFTHLLAQTSHSVATISSALTATLTLLVATTRVNVRVTWESILAGIFSSIFVALYPVQLQRTYKCLLSQLVLQGECLSTFSSTRQNNFSGSKEESRAYWRLLHYNSVLAILIFTPIVLLSGEIKSIWRNCYILDVYFHWLMVLCGGLGSWAVFWATIALTRATSPLIVAFLFIPRAAFLLPIISDRRMPTYSWIGVCMCWASCLWFYLAIKRDTKSLERTKL